MGKSFTEHLEEILPKFKGIKTIVVGDLMTDKYLWADGARLSTEAPVQVVKIHFEEYYIGGAANIGLNCKVLGADVQLCGLIGFDDAAHYFRKEVLKTGIGTAGIFPSNHRPTTQKIRVMSETFHQQYLRLDREVTAPLHEEEKATLYGFIESFIPDVDVLIMADFDKGVLTDQDFCHKVLKIAEKYNITTVVYSRPNNFTKFHNIDLLISSQEDAGEFVYRNYFYRIDQEDRLVVKMKELVDCRHLITFKGDRGIHLVSNSQDPIFVPTFSRGVYELSGTGDIITSTAAIALGAKCDILTTTKVASLALDAEVKESGIVPVTSQDLISMSKKKEFSF